MKFILVSPKNRTAYNFRGDLVKKIIASEAITNNELISKESFFTNTGYNIIKTILNVNILAQIYLTT